MPPRRKIPPREVPKTPNATEARYVRDLTKVWEQAQQLIAWAMSPLVKVWPKPITGDGLPLADAIHRGLLITDGDDLAERRGKNTTRERLFVTDEDDRGETEEERIARELGDWFEAQAAAGAVLAQKVAEQLDLPFFDLPTPVVITPTTIRSQSVFVRFVLEKWLGTSPAGAAIDTTASQVDRFALGQLRQVLAIDLRQEIPGMQEIIDQFRETNIRLIESGIMAEAEAVRLRPGLLPDVSQTVELSHAQGLRVEELQAQIKQRYGVSDARAELIARDQTLKLNSEVSQYRQQQAGITQFYWVSSKDSKVRPSHKALDNGQAYYYSNPPLVEGKPLLPGQDFQCRCIAAPVRPAYLAA